ncbi:hypothetical protein QOZ80_8AG0638030 [Eleusine coracana subsp. coracana]|nr:hypothetical protein QOZ80_8AG0638030 [Eleusine coracana subsp. coracana]
MRRSKTGTPLTTQRRQLRERAASSTVTAEQRSEASLLLLVPPREAPAPRGTQPLASLRVGRGIGFAWAERAAGGIPPLPDSAPDCIGKLVEARISHSHRVVASGRSLIRDRKERLPRQGCGTMSRCFPYPPPGYEPRLRSEHKDLLKKERHKGEKHRKENGRVKGEKYRKDRGKGERKENDRDHKKLKREKRRERRKNKDRNKHKHQCSEKETQKVDDFDNRSPEDRRKHEAVKDIKRSDELVAQFPGQGGHAVHKVNSTNELLRRSSNDFGATAFKEKGSSLSRMVKRSGHAAQHYHGIGLVQKNGSVAYANKKGAGAGVGSQTRIKNGKNLQVGSVEKHSSRRHSNKMKNVERNGDVDEQNKVEDLMHLACLDEQKFACDDIKKRKEFDANSTLHENGMKTTKLPRMSPTNITRVNGKTSPHTQEIAPYSSTELVGANTQEVDWHKPQGGYSNGITGSRYLEQQKVSVSSSVYDTNEGYLKPPHPDTKYLSQVESVPPREDISECIDQDWLFPEDHVERKTATFEAAESHQVWSGVQLVDTAGVVALPYVVPL